MFGFNGDVTTDWLCSGMYIKECQQGFCLILTFNLYRRRPEEYDIHNNRKKQRIDYPPDFHQRPGYYILLQELYFFFCSIRDAAVKIVVMVFQWIFIYKCLEFLLR